MTEDRAAEALQFIERAHNELGEVCAEGPPRRFRMSIPANRDRDTDLIIGNALLAAKAVLDDLPALLAAEREKALLAVQSYSEAELAAERERGRVEGLRQAHRQILDLLGAPAPEGLAEPAPGEEAAPQYPAGHGYTPHTGPFGDRGCRVMLARYSCPYTREQHDPDLSPVDVDVFGYRRGRFASPAPGEEESRGD